MSEVRSVCVFCASSTTADPAFLTAAKELGQAIAKRGWTLVYGGATVGLMGAVAEGALEAGGRVVGILPKSLEGREIAHPSLTEFHLAENMHERKAAMYERSDAFITLPGGYGTLDELFECLVWVQIGVHQKPMRMLNVNGYFDALIEFLRHATEVGTLKPENFDALVVHTEIDSLLGSF